MKYTVMKQHANTHVLEETRTKIDADNEADLKSILINVYNAKIVEINSIMGTVTIEA